MTNPNKVKASELSGRFIRRANGGYVFVGKHPRFPDDTGVVMCNDTGEITSFRLSTEGRAKLTALLTDPDAGEPGPPPPPPLVIEWKLVEPTP